MHYSIILVLSFAVYCYGLGFTSNGIFPRQNVQPGTPEYQCHADCGGVIQDAGSAGYCTTDQFKTQLAACLECALKYDIWKYYGSGVTKAAGSCGLNSTPLAVSSNSTTSTSVASTSQISTSVLITSTPTSVAVSTTATTTSTSSASAATFSGSANIIAMDEILAFVPILAAFAL